ncbi:hypothetical protein [Bordetella bronchiseptica]|uniref:hypothetical protein n=1 Tax=Bordetella bronchiseptica TaxID=518 RepID=UPI001268D7D3|nr:hypothetical protein [Bordetella bronchiseptica]
MHSPDWQVIGQGASGLNKYEVQGKFFPNGILARIVFDELPPVELQGLFLDTISAVRAAVPVAASIFRN